MLEVVRMLCAASGMTKIGHRLAPPGKSGLTKRKEATIVSHDKRKASKDALRLQRFQYYCQVFYHPKSAVENTKCALKACTKHSSLSQVPYGTFVFATGLEIHYNNSLALYVPNSVLGIIQFSRTSLCWHTLVIWERDFA